MLCSVSHPAPLVAYAFVHKLIKQLSQIVGKAAANVLCCAVCLILHLLWLMPLCLHKLIKQLLQIVGKAAANVLCCATVSSLAPPVCTSFLSSCRRQ